MATRWRDRSYFPLFIADYEADTLHLNAEEHGAYLMLLMAYWKSGKPLPDDPTILARTCRMTRRKWNRIATKIEPFFARSNGFLVHKRVEAELAHAREISQKAKENIAKRWEKKDTAVLPANNGRNTDVVHNSNSSIEDSESDTTVDNQPQKKESGTEVWAFSENPKSPKATNKMRGTRWDGRPVPDEWIEEARQIRAEAGLTEIDLRVEAASFADYWVGVSGQKGTKNDWRATWRNWARRANGRPTGQGQPGRGGSITADLQHALDYFDKNRD